MQTIVLLGVLKWEYYKDSFLHSSVSRGEVSGLCNFLIAVESQAPIITSTLTPKAQPIAPP